MSVRSQKGRDDERHGNAGTASGADDDAKGHSSPADPPLVYDVDDGPIEDEKSDCMTYQGRLVSISWSMDDPFGFSEGDSYRHT